MPEMSEIEAEISTCLNSGMVTNNSAHVRKFEDKLQEYFGSLIKPSAFCNGELALYSLIQAWKHKLGCDPHDSFEVIVPSLTFSGTISAIVQNNLKPVFCDVDEGLVLDLKKAEVDSPDLKMILPVGAYGNIVDLNLLHKLSEENSLAVVMDNAPAFGTKFEGRFPCDFGFSEIISFHATKILNSMEGGAAIVNDCEIAEYLMRLREFGQYEKTRGDVDIPGLNSKMTEVCALVGLKNLAKAEYIIKKRKENASRYIEYFSGMEEKGLLRTMKVNPSVECPYLYFPIILNEEATAFVDHLESKGVSARRYYTATHNLKFYKDRYRKQDLSYTESIMDRLVALPLHTEMTDQEIEFLLTSVDSYFSSTLSVAKEN